MDKIHKSALRQSRVALVRDLQTDQLFDHLEAKGIFTPIMLEYIKAEHARPDKVRHLLDDLCRRGPNAYELFLDCLRESDQHFLAEKILEQERTLRGTGCGGNSKARNIPSANPTPVGPGQTLCQPTSEPKAPYQYSGISMNNSTYNNLSQNSRSGDDMDLQCSGEVPIGNTEPAQASLDMELDELDLTSPPQSAIGHQSTSYQSHRSQDRCYKMDSSPRGKAIIINNKHFVDGSIRKGTDVDVRQLLDLFHNVLNVDAVVLNNLTAESMKQKLQEFAIDQNLNQVDSLMVCILTHGGTDKVYGTDCHEVNVNNIFDIFGASNCSAMNGKPKLFLINACRGDNDGEFVPRNNRAHHDAVEKEIRQLQPRDDTIPVQSDIIAAFSTFPGFVSLRDPDAGSWFVQSFVDVFKEMAHTEHVLDMLTEVNRRVGSRYDESVGAQMPFPSYSTTKKWFLNPVS